MTVGIDVGGTFTDFVFVRENGDVTVRKRPTTSADPSCGVLDGLRDARSEGLIDAGYTVSHGTTTATNALLERRGARTGLITTRGFRDVLEIGRQARRSIYSLDPDRAPPLIPRCDRFEVTERIDWMGRVVTPLDESELAGVVQALVLDGVESVAICFLFSHLNPVHERRAALLVRERGLAASISADVAPEPREFERTATVAANAFVAPTLQRYLQRLEAGAQIEGAARVRVMQSNGGALALRDAGENAVKTALSGPAGGVLAATRIAADSGLERLLTFDMGGTSTDVALVVDGKCPVVSLSVLGGMPLRTPTLDIHTVGAGGGSQAWIDSAGALRVGPASAGADPGPVAYGKGEVLTVTDANVLLGRIPADVLLAGRVALDARRVRECFDEFAARLQRSPESLALGIVSIAEASMARALRHISVERGHDPAGFVLASYGGAGGLHACALARALGVAEVLVPRFPGALSALGLAIAPIGTEFVRAIPAAPVSDAPGASVWQPLRAAAKSARAEADAWKERETEPGVTWHVEMLADLRYAGQSYELRAPFDPADPRGCVAVFHAMHRRQFGHADTAEPVECTAVRCVLSGLKRLPPLRFPVAPTARRAAGVSRLHDGAGWMMAKRYDREELAEGQTITGPALVLQADAATLIGPGWTGAVDRYGSLRLTNSRVNR
jgi:N-methylhydantoinase A